MLTIIDNYDSFTYNLVHFLGEVGATVEVFRNDQLTAEDVIARAPSGIVLSPGPCTPDEAGICLELVRKVAGTIPILGVCLGHQSIGQAYGGKTVRIEPVMHGKLSRVVNNGTGLFAGLPASFDATRYHSLVVERATLPDCLAITAETDDGIIMGLAHKEHPVHGVQFHPESIASEHGHELLRNFVRMTGVNMPEPVQ